MMRFFGSLVLFPLLLAAQPVRILSYDVRAAVSERTYEITGAVSVTLIAPREPSDIFPFLVPAEWEITSIRSAGNEMYDFDSSPAGTPFATRVDVELPEEGLSDTLSLQIDFRFRPDTIAVAQRFVSSGEILLMMTDSSSWLPTFGSDTTGRGTLEFAAPSGFSVFSSLPARRQEDSLSSRWIISAEHEGPLSALFTVAGIRSPSVYHAAGPDSLCSVTLIAAPSRLNRQYGAAVAHQLSDAAEFFTSLTGLRRADSIRIVIIGDATFAPLLYRGTDLLFHRGSPAFTVFDSSALQRLDLNHWLTETAQRFSPPTADTTAVFDDGFAAYLSLRFLQHRFPSFAVRERIATIAQSLTFFPSGTIAEGHRSPANTNEILSYRGRAVFGMLEQLLGRAAFDSVVRRLSATSLLFPVTLTDFQSLCEDAYGTPLDGFFSQWFRHSGAPEYVIQWNTDITPRGMSVVSVTIEQRGIIFSQPVPLLFTFGRRPVYKRVMVDQQKQRFSFIFPTPPSNVELDPEHTILRWLLEIRIPAHARTALLFLSILRDTENAEREALYTLQLDPNNSTGSAPLAYFVLGNSAAAGGALDRAKEYFLKAMNAGATTDMERYKLLSLVQYANVLELEGKREDATILYRRAISEGMNSPILYEQAMIKADLHLRGVPWVRTDAWFELH